MNITYLSFWKKKADQCFELQLTNKQARELNKSIRIFLQNIIYAKKITKTVQNRKVKSNGYSHGKKI